MTDPWKVILLCGASFLKSKTSKTKIHTRSVWSSCNETFLTLVKLLKSKNYLCGDILKVPTLIENEHNAYWTSFQEQAWTGCGDPHVLNTPYTSLHHGMCQFQLDVINYHKHCSTMNIINYHKHCSTKNVINYHKHCSTKNVINYHKHCSTMNVINYHKHWSTMNVISYHKHCSTKNVINYHSPAQQWTSSITTNTALQWTSSITTNTAQQ